MLLPRRPPSCITTARGREETELGFGSSVSAAKLAWSLPRALLPGDRKPWEPEGLVGSLVTGPQLPRSHQMEWGLHQTAREGQGGWPDRVDGCQGPSRSFSVPLCAPGSDAPQMARRGNYDDQTKLGRCYQASSDLE